MKRLIQFVLAAIFLTVVSCNTSELGPDGEDVVRKPKIYTQQQANAVKEYIKLMGCPEEKIEDMGDYFLADGIMYEKDMPLGDTPHHSDAASEEHAHSGTARLIWKGAKQRNIRVRVSATIPRYNAIAEAAMHKWNEINDCSISFSRVPSGQDILIASDPTPTAGMLIKTSLPINGNPGQLISINTRMVDRLETRLRTSVIAHALGDAIGFRHEDWRQQNEAAAQPIPRVENRDPFSITTSGYHRGENMRFDFSLQDWWAARSLYPDVPQFPKLTWLGTQNILFEFYGPVHKVKYYEVSYKITASNGRLIVQSPLRRVNVTSRFATFTIPVPQNDPFCQCSGLVISAIARIVYDDNFTSAWSRPVVTYR